MEYVTVKLATITCCKCQVLFAITARHQTRLIDSGENFWCPKGHSQCYTEPTEVKHKKELDKLNKQLNNANVTKQFWIDQATAAERSKSALKGVVTKKNKQLDKIKNGVCACCDRFFENLHKHMTNQHPDFEPSN